MSRAILVSDRVSERLQAIAEEHHWTKNYVANMLLKYCLGMETGHHPDYLEALVDAFKDGLIDAVVVDQDSTK